MEEKTSPIIKVGEKEVDLSPALPLLLRDWLALEEVGVTIETMQHASLKVMHELAKYVIRKADATASLDGVLDMTMRQLREVFSIVGEAEMAAVDRPSSTSSTN